MAKAPVPGTFDELIANYELLIDHAIRSVLPSASLPGHDLDDLRQIVYTSLIQRDYLARCRVYLEAHPQRKFSTSLFVFTRRLMINALRDSSRRPKLTPTEDEAMMDHLASRGATVARDIRETEARIEREQLERHYGSVPLKGCGSVTLGQMLRAVKGLDAEDLTPKQVRERAFPARTATSVNTYLRAMRATVREVTA